MADTQLHIVKGSPARFVFLGSYDATMLTGYVATAALLGLNEQVLASITEGAGIERSVVGGCPQFTLSFTPSHTAKLQMGARLVLSLQKPGEAPLQDSLLVSVRPNLIPNG